MLRPGTLWAKYQSFVQEIRLNDCFLICKKEDLEDFLCLNDT